MAFQIGKNVMCIFMHIFELELPENADPKTLQKIHLSCVLPYSEVFETADLFRREMLGLIRVYFPSCTLKYEF